MDGVDTGGREKSHDMHHEANTSPHGTPMTGLGQVQVVATHGVVGDLIVCLFVYHKQNACYAHSEHSPTSADIQQTRLVPAA